GRHGTLVDDDGLGLVGLEDRHAVDGRALLQGGGIDDVVRAKNHGHVDLAELAIDIFHFEDLVVGHFGLGQQHVHMARHAPRDRMDGVAHRNAHVGKLLGEFLHRVLGARHGQPVPRHDDYGFGVAQNEGGVVGAAALYRALLPATAAGRNLVTTEATQNHVEERAVHGLAHDVA